MKHFKLTFFLTLLMSMIGMQAFADFDTSTSVQVNDLYYNLDSDNNQAQITYNPSGRYTGDITIPSSITYENKSYSVTSIRLNAFYDCRSLTSVTIPNSVTSIGDWAFRNCFSLTSITIGNSVTSIGYDAFKNCSSLTSVTLNSNSIVSTGYTSSNNIKNIFGEQVTEYIIGDGVTSIGDYAFYGCGATTITIPNSVTSIGEWAFFCSGLTSIIIPNSVTSIGDCAFQNCSGLTSVTISENVTSIGGATFAGCSGLTSIIIPNSVTSIGGAAFADCSGLTSVTIPNSVTSIGKRAFSGCFGLTSVVVEPGNTIYDSRDNCNAIIETSSNTLIAGCKNTIIPKGVTSIYDCAFEWCFSLTSITIPSSVTSIGNYAFELCGLTSVYCFAADCPQISTNSFNVGPCTLHVLAQSLDAYKNHELWGKFEEIVPLTDEEMAAGQIALGHNSVAPVIYNLNGHRISNPTKGLNIIRSAEGRLQGKNGRKVLIK